MNASGDLRPLLGPLFIASLVLIVVNSVLYSIAFEQEGGYRVGGNMSKPHTAAIILGIIGTLVWTVLMWPIMTGPSRGAYVVYVNGVASSGGVVDILPGFVPLFIMALALIGLPQAIGLGIYRMRTNSRSGSAYKPSIGKLIVSIVAIVIGFVFIFSGLIAYTKYPGRVPIPRLLLVVGIGAVPLALGIRGVLHYASAKRK